MIRRTSGALIAVVLLATIAAGSVQAAVTPAGALRAAFESYWQGGNGASFATFGHDANSWFHAANTEIDLEAGAARIGPFDGTYCSNNLFGIWTFFFSGPTRAQREEVNADTLQIWFGPAGGTLQSLPVQQSSVARGVSPTGFYGDFSYDIQAKGVPVYGHLSAGVYTFHAEDRDGNVWDATDTIVDC